MSHTLQVDHNNKIIYYSHFGIANLIEIGKCWEELVTMKEFTELKYNLLSDYSEATLQMEISDLNLIRDFLYSLKDILKDKKQAFIVTHPTGTVLTMLFEEEVYNTIGFITQTFSTKEGAHYWLCH